MARGVWVASPVGPEGDEGGYSGVWLAVENNKFPNYVTVSAHSHWPWFRVCVYGRWGQRPIRSMCQRIDDDIGAESGIELVDIVVDFGCGVVSEDACSAGGFSVPGRFGLGFAEDGIVCAVLSFDLEAFS